MTHPRIGSIHNRAICQCYGEIKMGNAAFMYSYELPLMISPSCLSKPPESSGEIFSVYYTEARKDFAEIIEGKILAILRLSGLTIVISVRRTENVRQRQSESKSASTKLLQVRKQLPAKAIYAAYY